MSTTTVLASSQANQASSKGFFRFVDRWVRKPIARRLSPPSARPDKPLPATTAQHPNPTASPTPKAEATRPTAPIFSTLTLTDGASIAYEILGRQHLGHATPIVLVCGMTSVRVDFERLTAVLVETHPVLVYDHRGIGDSTTSTAGDEAITIELFAKDLLALITHVGWKRVALVGYSMGGVITQQLLVLPHLVSNPKHLPFEVSHVVLAGTRSVVTANAGLDVGGPVPPTGERTLEEKKAIARRIVSTLVDPAWIEANPGRFSYMFKRATNPALNRPTLMIVKQGAALRKFDFAEYLDKIVVPILIIHGKLDQVIPFSCSEDTIKRLSTAKLIEVGEKPGQVPTLDFGHFWFEYFDASVWRDVITGFIQQDG